MYVRVYTFTSVTYNITWKEEKNVYIYFLDKNKVILIYTVFGDSRFFSISSRLVTIRRPWTDRMLQNRFTLPQVRLDITHEFLGFWFEAACHVTHVTWRDVCECFRVLCYGKKRFVHISRVHIYRRKRNCISHKVKNKVWNKMLQNRSESKKNWSNIKSYWNES